MLANGIKLGYSASGTSTYTNMAGLQEVPEMGMEVEKVEITALSDAVKKYENGIGDYGDLEFTFLYENKTPTSAYRVMRGYSENGSVVNFQMEYPDKTKFTWSAQVSVKLSGGGVNDPLTFTLSMALQSNIVVVDPTV